VKRVLFGREAVASSLTEADGIVFGVESREPIKLKESGVGENG
jgi:hypothetical protein